MKKTVILILAILPIFLLITISFAGKILSLYSFISVESVTYVDEHNEKLDDSFTVKIDRGETYQAMSRVLPELATDKSVKYVSDNLNACTVDENGLITGMGYGTSHVNVITNDGKKTDTLTVIVSDNNVSGVELSTHELEIIVGEMKKIGVTIEPFSALNKNVTWASSDSKVVKVDSNGFIKALSPGTVEVFVITEDGMFTDLCMVTVVDGIPSLAVDFEGSTDIVKFGEGYRTLLSEVDLKDYIIFNPEMIKFEDINVIVESGKDYVSLSEDLILTFNSKNKVISLFIYVGDVAKPTYMTNLLLIYN